jgi:hypothetical protein
MDADDARYFRVQRCVLDLIEILLGVSAQDPFFFHDCALLSVCEEEKTLF